MSGKTPAMRAVNHVLHMMRKDGRVAYLLGKGSQSFELLTEAAAKAQRTDPDTFREEFWQQCQPTRVIVHDQGEP
jgi:hypothetical protein